MNPGQSKKLAILGFALAFACLIAASSAIQSKMNEIRVREKLVDSSIMENAPPVIAFTTVALGSFRGLLADILWLRTVRLQDRGQYFEMVQLASWITKLQPRFTSAIAYLAWNMAYNISVTCSSFEDRWRWVNKGIELIRDEALKYNMSDPGLYKELGWIYQHKLGNVLDDANIYYKNRMALEMMKVFGAEVPDWTSLASAHDYPDELLDNASGGKLSFKDVESSFRSKGALDDETAKLFKDPGDAKKFELALRKKWLKEKYRLDPEKVVEINQKYGALDWRLPEAHAIYWATMGIACDKSGSVNINCERMITQALKEAFLAGKILIYDEENFRNFMTVPNLDLADAVRRTYEEAYERQKSSSFKGALENFLVDAAVLLYNFGQYQKAEEYLRYLARLSPENPKFRKPLDTFILQEWMEDIQSSGPRQAMDIIGGLIFRSCFLLAAGERNSAAAHERMAAAVYARYQSEHRINWERMGLPPFESMKSDMVKQCIKVFPPRLSKMLQQQLSVLEYEKKDQIPSAAEKSEARQ